MTDTGDLQTKYTDAFTSRLAESSSETSPLDEAFSHPSTHLNLLSSALQEETPSPGHHFSSLTPLAVIERCPSGVTNKLFKEIYSAQTRAINLSRYEYAVAPPSITALLDSLDGHGLQAKVYRPPHYSSSPDISERPREYAGLLYHLKGGRGITHLDAWNESNVDHNISPLSSEGIGGWEYSSLPPSAREIRRWLVSDQSASGTERSKLKSQIEGTTQKNIYGLKDTPGPKMAPGFIPPGRQTLVILALEVFAPTSEGKSPNADINPIVAVFYTCQDLEAGPWHSGTIIVQHQQSGLHHVPTEIEKVEVVGDEVELINRVIDLVGTFDPDVVTGWDIQMGSWGYLNDRAQHHGSFPVTSAVFLPVDVFKRF
ncbi:hypothetical protein H0H87_000169 [Tephrocybe sp. NHM501043]|nr:hypothetical protein H0H87_000169 [Tephrocybe sp. NHM501043]